MGNVNGNTLIRSVRFRDGSWVPAFFTVKLWNFEDAD